MRATKDSWRQREGEMESALLSSLFQGFCSDLLQEHLHFLIPALTMSCSLSCFQCTPLHLLMHKGTLRYMIVLFSIIKMLDTLYNSVLHPILL